MLLFFLCRGFRFRRQAEETNPESTHRAPWVFLSSKKSCQYELNIFIVLLKMCIMLLLKSSPMPTPSFTVGSTTLRSFIRCVRRSWRVQRRISSVHCHTVSTGRPEEGSLELFSTQQKVSTTAVTAKTEDRETVSGLLLAPDISEFCICHLKRWCSKKPVKSRKPACLGSTLWQ